MRARNMTYPVFLLGIRLYVASAQDACILPNSGLLVSTVGHDGSNLRLEGYGGCEVYASPWVSFKLLQDIVELCLCSSDSAGNVFRIFSECMTEVDAENGTVQALNIRKLYTLLDIQDRQLMVPSAEDFIEGTPELILPEKFSDVLGQALDKAISEAPKPKRPGDFVYVRHNDESGDRAFRLISICVMFQCYLDNKDAILAEAWFHYVSQYMLKKYMKES